jgi:hypothetical protein
MEIKSDSQLLRDIDTNVQQMRTELFGIRGDNGFVGETKDRLNAYSARIRSIEKWMYMVMGAIAIIGFFIAQHLLIAPAGK